MYTEKNDRELIELLEMHKKLTFQAQLSLLEELNRRSLTRNVKDLESTIEKKMSEIRNLEYLKDIGFEAQKNGSSIKVTRTTKAVLIDLLATFLGIIFCFVGALGLIGLLGSFFSENAFSLSGFIGELCMIALGVVGIKFLNGLKRLIDFSGFELLNSNGDIILKKRFDIKIAEIQKSESLLNLEKEADRLVLKLEKDEIFYGNADNIVQNLTMRELNPKLKTVANNTYN